MSLDELRLCLTNRKYDDLHPILTNCMDLIEEKCEINLESFKKKLYSLIRFFYNDNILISIDNFWSF